MVAIPLLFHVTCFLHHFYWPYRLLALSFHSQSEAVTLEWDVDDTGIHWFSPNRFNDFSADGDYIEEGFKIVEDVPSTGHVTADFLALGDWGSSNGISYTISKVNGDPLNLASLDYFITHEVSVESSKGGNIVLPTGFNTYDFTGPDWTDISYFTLIPVSQSVFFQAEGVIYSMEFTGGSGEPGVPEPATFGLVMLGMCLVSRRPLKAHSGRD